MSRSENKISESYLTPLKDILEEEGLTEIGFVRKLSKRAYEEDTLTADLARLPQIFAQVPGIETPQPLIVGKFYDDADDDDYSPESYLFISEKALVYNPHTHEISVVYNYRRENASRRYEIADDVSFFSLTENGQFKPFTPQ